MLKSVISVTHYKQEVAISIHTIIKISILKVVLFFIIVEVNGLNNAQVEVI